MNNFLDKIIINMYNFVMRMVIKISKYFKKINTS